MSYNFRGKTALVTGASRGIGKEITKQLASAGAKVYALARTQENLDALKTEVPGIETICVDLSNWEETKKLVEDIDDIDLLVNNAGIAKPSPFGEITEELLESIFSVNFKPAINISQVVVGKLIKQGKPGSIVNMSSLGSLLHHPDSVLYCTSKAALDKLTKSMAVELAPFKIRVNAINPCVVVNDTIKLILAEQEVKDAFVSAVPLREFCNAEDVANSVLFLLSDKARMITGTILPVDGGQNSNTKITIP